MSEYLLNNCIDTDFQKFLCPLNIMHFIAYSPKYCLSDNFVTPNNRKTKWRSFCCVLCYVLIFYTLLAFQTDLSYYDVAHIFVFVFIYLVAGVSFFVNYFVNSFQSDAHVNFVVIIQTIRSLLKFVNIDFKSFIIINWFYVFVVIFSYFCLFVTHIYQGKLTIVLSIHYIGLMIIDSNIIYIVRMIELLTHIIFTWMSELKYINDMEIDTNRLDRDLKKSYNTLTKAYLEVLKAACCFEELARIPVIFYTARGFINIIIHVECLLQFPQEFWSNAVAALIWIFKHFLLMLIISFKTEKFYTTLKNTQVMMLVPENTAESPRKRLLYRTVLRAGTAAYVGRQSDAFALDATLPLNFFSCVATYVVVLLQFRLT
nr:gustatory receptor 29 [Papilio dardanus]